MTFHLEKRLNLAERQVLSITQSNKLIEGAEQFVGISKNLPLVQGSANARHDLRKKMQRIDVLQDVRLPVGDEDHVKFVEWLVDIAHVVLLHGGVLRARVGKLWEGCQ